MDFTYLDENTFVHEVRRELENQVDHVWKKKLIMWLGECNEEPRVYGVPTPFVRKLSVGFFTEAKSQRKDEILRLCEQLLSSVLVEERTIAFDWAFRLKRQYEKSDFDGFESWLNKYVHDWGSCDDLCAHAFGTFISVSRFCFECQEVGRIFLPVAKTSAR